MREIGFIEDELAACAQAAMLTHQPGTQQSHDAIYRYRALFWVREQLNQLRDEDQRRKEDM